MVALRQSGNSDTMVYDGACASMVLFLMNLSFCVLFYGRFYDSANIVNTSWTVAFV